MITSIIRITRTALAKLRNDLVSVFAAQAAFFIILSFFPFIMLLLTLIQYLPLQESMVMTTFTDIMPQALHAYIITIISEIYDQTSTTIISITALTALWSASKGFLALVRGFNSVYDINETRNYFKLRAVSALYTLVFILLLIVTLLVLVFGNRLFDWVITTYPILEQLALVLISIRAIVTLTVLTIFFLLMYVFVPNRETKMMRELPGALLAAAGWLVFSYLYSFYINNMGNFSATYGSLTAIVLLMLWIYFCMYILFIGAEFNVLFHTLKNEH